MRSRFALMTGLVALIAITVLAAQIASPRANGSFASTAAESKAVKVFTKRDGMTTHFYVENDELCEVTMTFEMSFTHLKSTTAFPYTASFPAGKVTEAFNLSADEPDAVWEYSYTNYYKIGSNCARHDDDYLYQLPYAPGSSFRVTQAFGGSFSHKGSNKYAIDWKMPQGTLVYAARAGLVVKVKDDSNKGGSSMKYDPFNNYVLIRHDDGTLGHYCHLQKGGCLVEPGQRVNAGDVLAHSGNTGFSSGPHLHFCVFKAKDGRTRDSIPIKFKSADQKAITLVEGRSYTAAPNQTATARVAAQELQPQGGSTQ